MKVATAMLLALTALILASACGGSSSPASEPTATPSPAEGAETSTATAAPTQPPSPTEGATGRTTTPSPSPAPATATSAPPSATATNPPAPTATAMPPTPTATTKAAQTHTVNLAAVTFVPANLTISAGDTVTWVWASVVHNIHSDGPQSFPGHPEFKTEGTYSFTFAQPGTYNYHCEVHPTTMKGSIIVQ